MSRRDALAMHGGTVALAAAINGIGGVIRELGLLKTRVDVTPKIFR